MEIAEIKWNDFVEYILKKYYANTSNILILEYLEYKISIKKLYNLAHEMGLKKTGEYLSKLRKGNDIPKRVGNPQFYNNSWSKYEEYIMEKFYENTPNKVIFEMLGGKRDLDAISRKAIKMSLKKSIEVKSKIHSDLKKGDKNPNYKGGKSVGRNGYIKLLMPDHPFADKKGYIAEHRYKMELKLGRYLKPDEKLIHLNGNKQDNSYKNLKVIKFKRYAQKNVNLDVKTFRRAYKNSDMTMKELMVRFGISRCAAEKEIRKIQSEQTQTALQKKEYIRIV